MEIEQEPELASGAAEETEPDSEKPEDETTSSAKVFEWRRYIRLAVGEYPIRNFYVARILFPVRARANILVTNLRVILYGVGGRGILGRSRFVQEVHLDRVVGVEAFIGWNFNYLLISLGLVMTVLGLLPYLNLVPAISHLATPRLNYLWFALIAAGIAVVLLSFRRLFYMVVKGTAISQEVFITAHRGIGWSDSPSLQFGQRPGPDAQQLIRDIGAIIIDAQNGEGVPEPPLSFPLEIEPTPGSPSKRDDSAGGAAVDEDRPLGLGSERRGTRES